MAIIRRGDLIRPQPGRPWALEMRIKPAPGQRSKRTRTSTGCLDYQDALRVAEDLRSQLLSGVHTWRKQVPTFSEWWTLYLAEFIKTAQSPDTVATKTDVGKVLMAWFGPMLLSQITPQQCEAFRDTKLKEDYAKATVALWCSQMKTSLNVAMNAKRLSANPWAGVAIPIPKRRQRVLTCEEQAILLGELDAAIDRAASDHTRMQAIETKNFITVALGTLLRIGTLTRITREHLELLKADGHFEIVTKRKRLQRVIKLPNVVTALESQAAIRHSRTRLFPVSPEYLRKRLAGVVARTSLAHFTPHDLRRTAATRLMKGDASKGIAPIPLPLLKEITGHTRIDTLVGIYTVAEDSAVEAAWTGAAELLKLGTNQGTPKPPIPANS